MNQLIQIECLPEILMGLHLNTEGLAAYMKEQAAVTLFREGKLSSGTAAKWLGMPRVQFLYLAMSRGAVLLDDSCDDYARETALT